MIVSELLYQSLRHAGVIQLSGRTVSASEMADAFVTLNALIDALNAEQLAVYAVERKTGTLSASTSVYTVGTGATFNFARPAKIEAASVLVGSPAHDQHVEVMTASEWAKVTNKGEVSNFGPRYLFYEALNPTGNVHVAPMPVGTMTLVMYVWAQIAQFANQAATVTLPPAYLKLITYNLAVELSLTPRFRRFAMDPGVAAIAKQAKADVANLNAQLNFSAAAATEAK
jgi:hypothetical protein